MYRLFCQYVCDASVLWQNSWSKDRAITLKVAQCFNVLLYDEIENSTDWGFKLAGVVYDFAALYFIKGERV